MDDEQIDRVLSREDEILPSSGFVASVMHAVRQEAAAPPPIPFPWKRAWPILGLAAGSVLAVLAAALVMVLRYGSFTVQVAPGGGISFWGKLPQWMTDPNAGLIVGSLVLAFVAVRFSMRLASR
jgi:hypothetical protein